MVTIDRLGYHTDFGICCEDGVSSEFPGITDAMWWAIVTVATVGYGDVVTEDRFRPGSTFLSVFNLRTFIIFPTSTFVLSADGATQLVQFQ